MFTSNKAIVAIWIVFWLYWLISAFGSKKNATPQIGKFFGGRVGVFILAVLLFRFINVQNYSFNNHIVSRNTGIQIVGFIIFISGLLLAIWARVSLGKNWGMPMTQKQNPELVTTGPYKYIRHPIYTGILVAILGTTIVSSIFWLFIFSITAIYFIYSALQEEKTMVKQFPKEYTNYKSKTKMLLPFLF
jgi:protein-S-isoprenylcysteine O-methyltransferase Ste14